MAMTRLKSDTKQAVKAIAQANNLSEDDVIKMLLAAYEQGNGASGDADSASQGAVDVLPPVDANSDLLKRLETIEGHVGANTRALARSLAISAARETGAKLGDDASSAAQFESYLNELRKLGASKHILETVEKQAKALGNG